MRAKLERLERLAKSKTASGVYLSRGGSRFAIGVSQTTTSPAIAPMMIAFSVASENMTYPPPWARRVQR